MGNRLLNAKAKAVDEHLNSDGPHLSVQGSEIQNQLGIGLGNLIVEEEAFFGIDIHTITRILIEKFRSQTDNW